MKSELTCLQTVKFSSINVLVLFYASVRVRGVLGDGSPSEITLYTLRNDCTKFDAFVCFIPILLLTDLTSMSVLGYNCYISHWTGTEQSPIRLAFDGQTILYFLKICAIIIY